MARSAAVVVENNFINGLVTEATALNFPEAAATETFNCIFKLDASITRREGIDLESGFTLLDNNRYNKAINTYSWESAAGNGEYNFIVVQIGLTIYFYTIGTGLSLSSGRYVSSTIDLTTYLTGSIAEGTDPFPEHYECAFSSGKGYLFVTHPYCEPIYIEYDPVGDTFSATQINIQIRDTEGVEDNLAVDTRPDTLSDEHKYNLYNQGWNVWETGGLNDPRPTGHTTVLNLRNDLPTGYLAGDPLSTWDSNRDDFPSNADIWWLFKDAQNIFQPKLASVELRGNSPAPKGHYILDAFNLDRSAAVNTTVNTGAGDVTVAIAGLPVATSGDLRPKAVEFFAGRVWYAGVDKQGFNNKIYFSQIITSEKEFGKCYQNNDPTNEHNYQLLPSDGGVIQILDCGSVIKLFAMQNTIVVFASNGIWSITGSTGIGFTADDFVVSKVSSFPTVSASSFVDVGGYPCWWNIDSIYLLKPADGSGVKLDVTSLTEKKIKRYYTDEIPSTVKRYVKGYFNPLTKVIQWLYRIEEPVSIADRYSFDHILNFNTITQAFYPWQVDSSTVSLNGIVSIQGASSTGATEDVTVSGVTVTAGGIDVEILEVSSLELSGLFKYLCSYSDAGSYKVTFAEEFDDDFKDWASIDEKDFSSYVISGYRVRGQAQKDFQTNYVVLYISGENGGGKLDFGSTWDYNTSRASKEWGRMQRVDSSINPNRTYSFRRLRIRGAGKSLQFILQSVSGEPFNVVGWSTFDTADNVV